MVESQVKREQRLAVRDERRAAQRTAASQPVASQEPKPKHWITVLIRASATAIWLGLASWSYTAGTTGDMIGAAIILGIAFFVAMGALLASERYEGLERKRRLALNLSVAALLALASVALFWWEYRHILPASPTAEEISEKIIGRLSQQPPAPPPVQTPLPSYGKGRSALVIRPRAEGTLIEHNVFSGFENPVENSGKIPRFAAISFRGKGQQKVS